ncbi:MAG: NUDIX hydrolase [Actinomycetes bacterium]
MSNSGVGVGTLTLRLGYRIASQLISMDRRIRSSHGRGVKLIMFGQGDRLLLVRHTYGGRHWTFPGGGVHTHEEPDMAAARELAEELAITAGPLKDLGSHPVKAHRRTDVVSVFTGCCDSDTVVPRAVEIARVGWFHEQALPDSVDPSVHTALGLLAGHRAEYAAANHHAT